jgi:hypothetical protein
LSTYQQSTTVAEVKAKHPFPWIEQRLVSPGGVIVRMLDAEGKEVQLFEMTALCALVSQSLHTRDSKSSVSESKDAPT